MTWRTRRRYGRLPCNGRCHRGEPPHGHVLDRVGFEVFSRLLLSLGDCPCPPKVGKVPLADMISKPNETALEREAGYAQLPISFANSRITYTSSAGDSIHRLAKLNVRSRGAAVPGRAAAQPIRPAI